ncbi:hypothetical protein VP1G_00182 [Cytospora mali]|uniref:Methyltransferase type 11 domain-containing protein n=1 Tax=Cytospora mali TaxID=578113 RepID=A0A194UMF5_CYTMA|nr:hypothetical protein VP1G_00182 [Valsa mali var. pyri (nom. inval.)]
MASLRSGPPRHGTSGDAMQSKRSGTYMETDSRDFPSSLSRRARKAAENTRPGIPDAPQTRTMSKIPQTSSHRGPSNPSTTATSSSAGPASRQQDSSKQSRNILPRDQSKATQEPAGMPNYSHNSSMRTDSSASVPQLQPSLDIPRDGNVARWLTGNQAEIRFPQKVELPTTNVQNVTIYPELDRYRDFQPQAISNNNHVEVPYPIWTDLPPPTPLFSGASSQQSTFSGSPSTRFSGSPGPGPYSRDTTPTSMSSQSPGLMAPIRAMAPNMKQVNSIDTRPPVTRRRAGSASNDAQDGGIDREGLSMVRESVTSYCSNSTVRDAIKEQKEKKRLSPIAPIPPLWKTSQKLVKKNGDTTDAPQKPVREPWKPASTVSSSAKTTSTTRPARGTADATTSRPVPPRRPSREGTADLHAQLGMPLPVVHSNLSSTSLADRRRSSSNLLSTATSSQVDRTQQPPAPRVGREPTPAPNAAATAPGTQTAAQAESRKVARTPSPNVSSSFKTRFPLFSRRNKSLSEALPTTAAEKKDRMPRKGPAAGTGHEGYGKLGQVRRRSGSMSNALRSIPGTMSSQESLASNQPSDPFLAERMNPVVIAGGEIIENRNLSSDLPRTESYLGYASSRPSLSSKNNSAVSLTSQEARNTLWPSALPRGATPSPAQDIRRPSDSSDSDGLAKKPTLAFRRSLQRLKTSDKANANMPKPISVRPGVATPLINSQDTTITLDGSIHDPRTRQMAAKADNAHPAPKKLVKRPKSPRKWNLFGRSSQTVSTKKQPEAPQLGAAVKAVQPKPVAFYAMIDSSEQEDEGSVDVKEVLREAQTSRPPSPPPQPPTQSEGWPSVAQNQSQESGVENVEVEKPQMAQVSRSTPDVAPTRERSEPAQPSRVPPPSSAPRTLSTRPSRLPQVGRIPKVVTSRPEPVPAKSFSRPFQRGSLQIRPVPSSKASHDEFVAKGPSPPNPSSPAEESRPDENRPSAQEETDLTSIYRLSRDLRDLPSDASRSQNEFLIFPRRKDSDCTSTTSSSCSGLFAYSDATAVVPDPSAPLAEDEIWDEYNDLIGDDTLRVPPSAGSSQGKPFHLEMWGRRLAKENNQSLESPTVDIVYSSDMTAKINEALEAAEGPTSSFSISEFVSGYGDDNDKDDKKNSSVVPQALNHQRTSTSWSLQAGVVRQSHASGSSQGSDDNSAVSQVNLRVGSMTVSKWLTFGHVLFSPVRDELVPIVGSLKRHSILVIDGLGNDDWSFYAAETYPAATFFNLSPRAPLPTEQQSPTTPLSPPNHHQIQYKSPMDKFPFGSQSFTAVVYRFPAAGPEAHYRNIITEARRVLKPGGYMELSILDMDMNNMGNRARRSVRQLKERIHIRSPDVSLSSSADIMLRLLGRKGFTDIKTCRVGVPVASAISPSPGTGMESSSRTSRAAAGSVTSNQSAARKRGKRDTRSLAEMISDDAPVADESITKMVAKVGRWWYDRCYVSVAREPGGKSMWNDQALLAECEEWRTTLKLMVCHARMPDGRSRVASI